MIRGVRQTRGFTLIEALIAAAILVIGLTGLIFFSTSSSLRRGHASRRATVTRVAVDQYNRLVAPGFDGLDGIVGTPEASFQVTDQSGRTYTIQRTVTADCNAVAGTTFAASPLPGTAQPCCTNGRCCRHAQVAVTYFEQYTKANVTEQYDGFVTKSCP